MTGLTDHQTRAALDVARKLAADGVPIFLAQPDPAGVGTGGTGFWLPSSWEQTSANPAIVDQWRPGMALCGVMGCGLDALDFDPRNGGTLDVLRDVMPTVYGWAGTPSGGWHALVAPLHLGSGQAVTGVDLKAGRPDGTGRGFLFLSPTVRRSKVDGVARPYRWHTAPTRLPGGPDGTDVALKAVMGPSSSTPRAWPPGTVELHDWPWMARRLAVERIAVRAAAAVGQAGPSWGLEFRTGLYRAAATHGSAVAAGLLTETDAVERLRVAIVQGAGVAPDEQDEGLIADGLEKGRAASPWALGVAAHHPSLRVFFLGRGWAAPDWWEAEPVPVVAPLVVDTAVSTSGVVPSAPEILPAADGLVSGTSDSQLAEDAADRVLRGRWRWAVGLGWLGWDGRRWAGAPEAAVVEAVRQWGRRVVVDAVDREADAVTIKALSALLSRSKILAVVALTRGMAGVLTDPSAFDAHPQLLNVANGVVDLVTGGITAHDPALLMTKVTTAEYHPGTTHEDWHKALNAIPEDVREWAQLRYGQSLVGEPPPDDLLIVQQGSGENGKTTFSGAVAEALGDYYRLISDKAIMGNPTDHSTELMPLRGARFGLIEETPEARRLSVARLKKIVGTPEITARLIRQDLVTFRTTHSLFLSTNYRPLIEETDNGTWRRLALLRFPYRFGGPRGDADARPRDRHLRQAVKQPAQQRAVLAWLVAGAVAWHAAGEDVELPARVIADTREWRAESDAVLGYLDERIVFEHGWCIRSEDLLRDLNSWLTGRRQAEWSDKLLMARFAEHSELRSNGAEKRKVRPGGPSGPALSTPPAAFPTLLPTAQTTSPHAVAAWVGMRFRTAADPTEGPSTP